jgi:ribose transport system substrate-binding protein
LFTAVVTLVVPVTLFAVASQGDAASQHRLASAVASHATAHATAGVAAATALIKKYTGIPKFVTPGPKLNPAKLKGKTIYTIFSSTAIPFCNDVGLTVTQAATKLGMKSVVWPNSGQLSQWVQGFNQAIAAHAALINVGCGINAAAVAPQIAAAKKAGIPVVAAHSYDLSQKVPASLSASQYAPYKIAGELEAAWAIKDTNGAADVLVVDDVADDVSSPALVAGIKLVFAQDCPRCKVTYKDVPIPSWGTQIGPVVSAALSSDPKLNYVIPIYDGMVNFVTPALTSHNATGVKISTFNGTPAVLDEMRTGSVVAFDSAENFPWIGLSILDQDMRVMLHMAPGHNELAPLQAWTKTNVKAAGTPASYSNGYGSVAQAGFAKLW